jgi:hypothetical protein
MAYFLFVDESGQDRRESPYEVLAGIAVEDRDLWNLVRALQEAEVRYFGTRYTFVGKELKAKKALDTRTYYQANQPLEVSEDERRNLARSCLESGATAGRREIAALAQAKIAYVREALEICARFRCKAFASIIDRDAPNPEPGYLRKDYAYLFERFFYFLEDKDTTLSGIIVFDELEKSQSHILVHEMEKYFKRTTKGRQRASQIIPEPFFVHSDLTTAIQLTDFVAYIISWGLRFEGMNRPARVELEDLTNRIMYLRYRTTREENGNTYVSWSFKFITDLRPQYGRDDDETEKAM